MNPLGLNGIEFVEYASPDPSYLHKIFEEFGFSRTLKHSQKNISLYQQNAINFMINDEDGSFGKKFAGLHGHSISSMGWRVKDANVALEKAVSAGAKACEEGDFKGSGGNLIPAIYGIGDSIIYFIEEDSHENVYKNLSFTAHPSPTKVADKGMILIDHLTNNVYKGELSKWADFYKNIFGFTEVRYFDIRGEKTGLRSFALKSPCGLFCIPINEGTERKSQINEYLDEYKGPGVQHLAFLTHDIVTTINDLKTTSIDTLDIDDEYYDTVFERVPGVTEDHDKLKELQLLVDGDDRGYLLQIFTKNLFGPIFIEIIQRKNHFSFGEGNFGALFRSIEKDQQKRGYFEE
ncbi:MAG: 4-hydroxyphenylpyruvate dioxygenase [Bacteriovoracaceae bacterium]|jgi:4-hydroxyphenylpyruvate dioxygenase|nr:4-hydroxyphenylpyruvate dioxygenase [Bacteriovoracaceae bacterium]